MSDEGTVRRRFGRRIRQLREARGWSQERLAAEARLHATYISEVEHGKRNISIDNIARLAEALDIPVAVLFGDG